MTKDHDFLPLEHRHISNLPHAAMEVDFTASSPSTEYICPLVDRPLQHGQRMLPKTSNLLLQRLQRSWSDIEAQCILKSAELVTRH